MTTNQKTVKLWFRVISIIGIAFTIALCIYGYKIGIFTSTEILTGFITKTGIWGPLVFILLQIVQVVIPIIPGGITCLAGVILFGPIFGFIYNYSSISVGSVINFLLARRFGRPFIQSISSKKTYQKYIGWLDKGKRFDRLFTIAILLPVAPDDFLCLLAGITRMTLKKFITIIILCKPVTIITYSIGLATIMSWIGRLLGT